MGLFPETIAHSLAGGRVTFSWLVKFDFTSETIRLWTNGYGLLKTADGAKWEGTGRLGAVSGIEQAINGEAPQATFTLSGIDAEIMRLARDEFVAEVKGRLVYVLIQFFGVDDPEDPDNQRPLDSPFSLWCGRCLTPTFTLDSVTGERSVSIAAESIFTLRSRPNYALYTDADQRRRFPGDRGFEFVGSLVNKVVTWPDY